MRIFEMDKKLFEVVFDDVFFANENPEIELTEAEAAALTGRMRDKGLISGAIEAVAGLRTSADDGDYDGDVKCFVTVTLHVRAESEESVEEMAVPQALLAALLADVDDDVNSSREGNWEVLEVNAVGA
ncbi:hypothetical protein WJ84_04015 [Burkholderia ubonensis]|nr:hypothetical protein WJ84_04015 [Burkholderia ubonensis]